MKTADLLNILGIAGQLLGFIILARDLWPEYRKAKRKQMILWLVGISRHAAELIRRDGEKAAFFLYATWKDGVLEALREVQRHWPDVPLSSPPDDFFREEKLKPLLDGLESKHRSWIDKIDGEVTYRSMYVGEAIFLIIAGYTVQFAGALASAKGWL
jgi:hypothetical protein